MPDCLGKGLNIMQCSGSRQICNHREGERLDQRRRQFFWQHSRGLIFRVLEVLSGHDIRQYDGVKYRHIFLTPQKGV